MGAIKEIPKDTRTSCITYLVLSDIHSIYMDKHALKLALNTLKRVPVSRRRVILNGDIMDFEFLHKKSQIFKDHIKAKDWDWFAEEIEKEILWYQQLEEAILEVVPNRDDIYYIQGNHEQRLERKEFYDKVPLNYRHWCNLQSLLNLDDDHYIKYKDWLKVGDLYVTHGHFCGGNPLGKHFLDGIYKSVLIGHTHEVGIKSFKGMDDITYQTYNNPCLCEVNPEYLENRNTNWDVGFTLVHVHDGKARVNIHSIKDGKVYLDDGTILK